VPSPERSLARIDPSKRALGTSGDPEDHDQARGIVDEVYDAQIADAQAPEVRSGELGRAWWTRFKRESEDRAP
jgi:hypothetical protein